jgi:hypothetical protein
MEKPRGLSPGFFCEPEWSHAIRRLYPDKSSGDLLLRKPAIELRVGNRGSSSDPRAGNRVVRG